MVPLDKLAQITQRFEFLEARLNAGAAPAEIATISREYSDLKPVADEIAAYVRALADLDEAEAMLSDPEMKALAEDEMKRAENDGFSRAGFAGDSDKSRRRLPGQFFDQGQIADAQGGKRCGHGRTMA